jgi:hypothetical protein
VKEEGRSGAHDTAGRASCNGLTKKPSVEADLSRIKAWINPMADVLKRNCSRTSAFRQRMFAMFLELTAK